MSLTPVELFTSYISRPSPSFFSMSTLQKLLSYVNDASVMTGVFLSKSSRVFSIMTVRCLLYSTSLYSPNSPLASSPTFLPFSKRTVLSISVADSLLYLFSHNIFSHCIHLQYLDFDRYTLFIISTPL